MRLKVISKKIDKNKDSKTKNENIAWTDLLYI